MSQLKYAYQDIQPVALCIPEETTTSRLYSSTVEGVEGQVSSLVETFLVEVYRCRVCQFTSSLKSKISSHVIERHELGRTCLPINCLEKDEGDRPVEEEEMGRGSPYCVEDELQSDSKESEDNMDVSLERMSFLLPMYGMLHNVSPQSCDMGLSTNSDGLHVAHNCEVSTLFEEGEESGQFRLEDQTSIESGPLSCPMDSTVGSTCEDQDEEMAQSAHLMSLGLCRISSMKTHPLISEPSKALQQAQEPPDGPAKKEKVSSSLPGSLKGQDSQDTEKKTFLCSLCNLDFASKHLLEVHLKCHDGEQGFRCLKCDLFVLEWSSMEKHLQGHGKEQRSHRCGVCQKTFRKAKSRDSHQSRHSKVQTPTQCALCPVLCPSEQEREQHAACHFQDTFKCLHCSFTDKSWDEVYKHLCDQHKPTEEIHVCTECNRTFSRRCNLKAHLMTHGSSPRILRHLCSELFRNWSDTEQNCSEIPQKKKKRRTTKRLQAQNSRKNVSKTHQETAREKKRMRKEFCCSLCDRKFSSKLALRRHMGIHSGVKPFECEDCQYKTRLKASLIQHMRIHTGEKPFKCSQCSYASIDASSLRRHSRIHTQEKPHQCQHCPYSCIQKKSLDLHVRRHHTGEAFSCHLCPYTSPDKQLIHRHIKRHHSSSAGST
ncbi:ZFP26 protein, partial [Atractosteus spatula]|nr:ZFP26 protein [Atractosteus spatula]